MKCKVITLQHCSKAGGVKVAESQLIACSSPWWLRRISGNCRKHWTPSYICRNKTLPNPMLCAALMSVRSWWLCTCPCRKTVYVFSKECRREQQICWKGKARSLEVSLCTKRMASLSQSHLPPKRRGNRTLQHLGPELDQGQPQMLHVSKYGLLELEPQFHTETIL